MILTSYHIIKWIQKLFKLYKVLINFWNRPHNAQFINLCGITTKLKSFICSLFICMWCVCVQEENLSSLKGTLYGYNNFTNINLKLYYSIPWCYFNHSWRYVQHCFTVLATCPTSLKFILYSLRQTNLKI